MPAESKQDRLDRIHREALAEFDQIQSAVQEVREQCLEDRRFVSIPGGQWEGALGDQFANKPKFEFNRTHLACIRVFNEYRANRITVDFTPKDGTNNDPTAEACDGLYRADEKSSGAEEAYDNAFDEGVMGGMGAWRLKACYEDEDDDENERQRVRFEPIFDADSCVFFDLNAKRQDKADAKRCFVLTPMTPDAYKAEYGDDPTTWDKAIHRTEFDWCTPDVVWVAEYYRVEEKSEVVRTYRGLALDDDEPNEKTVSLKELRDNPEMEGDLLAMGFRLVRERRVERRVVHKYILSGGKVLEDCGRIVGKCIPVVPFYGKRWVVDGVERCMGHVRLAKDAQRLSNMLMSWLAEMAARFDIEKPIFSPEQIAGHATKWAEDNVEKYPYLLANLLRDENGNPIPGSNAPIAYTKAPNIPPAMAALTQIAFQALTDLLGNQEAGEEVRPNLSGKAVELIQQRLDMQVFIYMSNFAKAMRRSGEIWLSMMKEIAHEEGRKMKTVAEDGTPGSLVLNEPAVDEKTGEQIRRNDLSKASLEVDVDVGPSSSSRRAATVKALTGMLQLTSDPEQQQVLSSLALMNMEGEGIGDARDYYRRKMVRMGVIKPTKEEAEALAAEAQNRQPDPQAAYLQAAATEAEANAAQARAKTVETIESAQLKRAQTQKTLAETDGTRTGVAIDIADAFQRAAAPPGSPAL